jgi:hypothetical protein
LSNSLYSLTAIPITVLNGRIGYRVKIKTYPYPISVVVNERNGKYYHYVQMKVAYKSYKVYVGAAGSISIGDVIFAIDKIRSKTNHDPGAYLV